MSRSPHPLRNVFMLAAAQMLGSSGLTVVVILGGIVAAQMAPRASLATVNDFTVFGSQACASLLAGLAVQLIGWQAPNLVTLPLLAAMIFTATRLRPAASPAAAVATVPSESRS